MESPGKNGSPLIRRRVEASTICLDTPPQTKPSGIGGGGDPELALLLRCSITKYIRSGRGRRQRHELAYRGVGAEASFVGTVPRDAPLDEGSVRVVIRRLLRDIRPLRDLDLTDGEWEAIVPEDVVPRLAGLARGLGGGCRAAAVVELAVDRHVRYSAPRVLMTACREVPAPGAGGKGGGECSICFEALALRWEEAAAPGKKKKGVGVELPGCAHAFHRRCISRWFRKKPTCPLCRDDVTKHLDPELRKHLAELRDDDLDPRLPDLLDAPGDVAEPSCDV